MKISDSISEQSDSMYRFIVENANQAIIICQDGWIKYTNPKTSELLGYTCHELKTIPLGFFDHKDSEHKVSEMQARKQAGEEIPMALEYPAVCKDGSIIWLQMHSTTILWDEKPATLTFADDVTLRKKIEMKLHESLEEKEIAFREIHHRVKNNLQIISSLINMQSRFLDDEKAKEKFRDCQSRIQSMALIHAQLYQSQKLSCVDFNHYAAELLTHLLKMYGTRSSRIQIVKNIDDVELDIDSAIYCGMIINELVSNILKHAFSDGRPGQIRIIIQKEFDGTVTLSVADNGVGLPENFDIHHNKSLGLILIRSLIDQLDGTFEIDGKNGTAITINFRHANSETSGPV